MSEPYSSHRLAGVLLPVASLPGPEGIGTLGAPSAAWLEWLSRAEAAIWQLLPLGPLGWGHSPYSSLSSFAGNPLLISIESLVEDGWLGSNSLTDRPPTDAERIDYPAVSRWKESCLRTAWEELAAAPGARRERLEQFRAADEQASWLEDWTLFAALRTELGGQCWLDWPEGLRSREPAALSVARDRLGEAIGFHTFVQFLFFDQLEAVRQQARRLGIELWGDLPFYPALDSADVWSRPELFDLDASGRPRHVAGVPPDAFAATGQLWGNPIYRWSEHAARGYDWWIDRIAANLRFADRLRLDHFRAFAACWTVSAEAATAAGGEWEPGPGEPFFTAVRDAFGHLPFIAEDLGQITDDVRELLRRIGLPGMRVLQFAFDSPNSEHLPENLPENAVVYTGTHDNDTTRGWLDSLGPRQRRRVAETVGGRNDDLLDRLLAAAFDSVASVAITPVQDLLALSSAARLNTPGVASGQWTWRLTELPGDAAADRLTRLVHRSDRRPRQRTGAT